MARNAFKRLPPKPLSQLADRVLLLLEQRIWAKILLGLFLGLGSGILLSKEGPFGGFIATHQTVIDSLIAWIGVPATIFLKLIQMVIVPLILASIVRGLAAAETPQRMRSVGLRFGLFVFLMTIFSATLGLGLANWLEPGRGLSLPTAIVAELDHLTARAPLSFAPSAIAELLPGNPIASIVQGQMLEVVLIAFIGGLALLTLEKSQTKPVLDLLSSIQGLCMTIIAWAMKIAPLAVFGLMTQVTSHTGSDALTSMGRYLLTSFLGFLLMLAVFCLLVWTIKKRNPWHFLQSIASPLLLAISTSSSAATMPLTLKVAEEEMHLDPHVVRYLIPLGTTINMAGSAIWQTIAVIFLSQVYNMNMSTADLLFVIATSVGSAIGSPGVPGVGIGILVAVLTKLGIPLEAISLIIGVDRLVDMGCTAINVAGDLTACQLIAEDATNATAMT